MKNIYFCLIVSFFCLITTFPQEDKTLLDNANLEGMVHFYGKKKYSTFSGRWVFKGEETWLLFKDGWALKNPELNMFNGNIEKLKKTEPDRWIQWKSNNKFDNASILEPSPKNGTYDISVALYSTNGTPVSSSVTTKRLKLMKNGTFETSVFSLADSNTGDTSTTIGKQENKKGTTASTIGKSGTGRGTVSTSKNQKEENGGNMSGKYVVDGHTIELQFDNGVKKQYIFATDGTRTYYSRERFLF